MGLKKRPKQPSMATIHSIRKRLRLLEAAMDTVLRHRNNLEALRRSAVQADHDIRLLWLKAFQQQRPPKVIHHP